MLPTLPISNRLLLYVLLCVKTLLITWLDKKKLDGFVICKTAPNQMQIVRECKFALLILTELPQCPNPS